MVLNLFRDDTPARQSNRVMRVWEMRDTYLEVRVKIIYFGRNVIVIRMF